MKSFALRIRALVSLIKFAKLHRYTVLWIILRFLIVRLIRLIAIA